MSKTESWRSLYPFGSHYLPVGAWRMHYVDEGAGRPLLMVHGNPTWSFYWRELIRAFRDEYRVIAVDHIGCGLSDKPADYPYTLQTHVDNLVSLIDSLDLTNLTLAVHDWGGAIGLAAALARPHRVSALVLFNTGAFPPPYIPLRIRLCRLPWLGTWCIRRWNLFARAALWMAVARRDTLTPTARAGLLAPYDNWDHRVAIDHFVRDIPAAPDHPTWQTLERLEQGLPTLADRPCQIIWGLRDWCFRPSCLERFRAIFPKARVHAFEDASHYVVEDAPQRIIPLMQDFLAHTGQDRAE